MTDTPIDTEYDDLRAREDDLRQVVISSGLTPGQQEAAEAELAQVQRRLRVLSDQRRYESAEADGVFEDIADARRCARFGSSL